MKTLYCYRFYEADYAISCEEKEIVKETNERYYLAGRSNSYIAKDKLDKLDGCGFFRLYTLVKDQNRFVNILMEHYKAGIEAAEKKKLECRNTLCVLETLYK